MPLVTTSDKRHLYVKEWGPSDGPPVVLVHGWPLDADSWDDVARYMRRHDGRAVSKAVLISSVLPCMQRSADNPEGVDPAVFDAMQQGLKDDRAGFLQGFFRDFYGVGLLSRKVSEGVLHWAWTMAMQAGLHPTLECAKAFAGTDFRADLPSFRVPTLLIHGTDDGTVPIDASSRRAVRDIVGAVLLEIADAPHGLLATDRDRVTAELLAFLRR
jgi:non-heme chloroperoxidase